MLRCIHKTAIAMNGLEYFPVWCSYCAYVYLVCGCKFNIGLSVQAVWIPGEVKPLS